jgi:polysaccharide pyruvyl transferase WcaK-like protein
VELIQRYKAILAVRLHANIIAASYQVPAVGFAWDEKVKGFYTAMGYPVRCLDLEALDASRAVERLWEAQEQGVHKEKVDILRAQVHDNVVGIVTQMLRGCEDPALRV